MKKSALSPSIVSPSVSTTVETHLQSLGVSTIERIDGPNRFAVSASVAKKGTTTPRLSPADSTSPMPSSIQRGGAKRHADPVVGTSSIPNPIKTFITKHPENVIVGVPATVSDTVKTQLEGMGKTVTGNRLLSCFQMT